MSSEPLQPIAAASIADWTWTIPNLQDLMMAPHGQVINSPPKSFSVMGQEFSFCYELTLTNAWGPIRTRLVNQSNRDVTIKSYEHPTEVYTLKHGEGCERAASFEIRPEEDGVVNGVVRNDAFILLDLDIEGQLDFLTLLEDPKDSDFKLICQDKEFPCHRNFLRARSSVLAGAFESSEKSGEYKLDKFNPDSVKKMLEFVYSSSFKGDADQDLLRLADFLDIQGLMKQCCQKLATTLSMVNVFNLLNLADTLNASAQILADQAIKFIAENFAELQDDPEWEGMTNRRMRDIFSRVYSHFSE